MKSLIAYFSKNGENYYQGKVIELEIGNTEVVANKIHNIIGGEIFKIETQQEYPNNYDDCVRVAHYELNKKDRPKLKKLPRNMNNIETIYLGYPNWWGTMPMAVFTFLESLDLSNKTIIPFSTSEGSSIRKSIEDIKRSCPEASVKEGLSLFGSEVNNADKKIEEWIHRV